MFSNNHQNHIPGRFRSLFVSLMVMTLYLQGIPSFALSSPEVGLYDIFEAQVQNENSYKNPFDFNVIELRATFTSPTGRKVHFFGFYDGDGRGGQKGGIWKLRFMPDEVGKWEYVYAWTDNTPGGKGRFHVVDTGLPGPLQIATDNPRYFMTSRGDPFHVRPYDLHIFYHHVKAPSFQQAMESLKKLVLTRVIDKGYNLTMWDGPGNRFGDTSWWVHSRDTRRFNIKVWHAFEDALRLCKDQEIYVITFSGMVVQGAQYDFKDFQVFLRYFVARFGGFYNFFGWSPTWEWTDIWKPSEVNRIMQFIHHNDPWKRLLTAHDCSHSSFSNWLGFSMRQAHSNNLVSGNSRRAGQKQGLCDGEGGIGEPFIDRPIIGSEDIWESTFLNQPRNGDEVRRGAWGIMMAGVIPLYSEWTPNPPPPGGEGKGEPEVRRMFDFFYSKTRYREYSRLNKDGSHGGRQISSGIPGAEYLVYDLDGGPMVIDLPGTSRYDIFTLLWFDPKTGVEAFGGSMRGGEKRRVISPFTGETVLLLTAEEEGI